MSLAVDLPESIQAALREDAETIDARRWALEAMVLEAVREGRITRGEAGEALGLGFHEREAFLKTRGISYDLSDEELEQERLAIQQMANR